MEHFWLSDSFVVIIYYRESVRCYLKIRSHLARSWGGQITQDAQKYVPVLDSSHFQSDSHRLTSFVAVIKPGFRCLEVWIFAAEEM